MFSSRAFIGIGLSPVRSSTAGTPVKRWKRSTIAPARRAWTIAETAITLGLSERSVWRQIGLGNLQVVKFGRATRVLVSSVDRLLKAGEAGL